MAGGGGGGGARELDQTPTWAVSAVVFAIILISIVLEKVLHWIGEWFQEKQKKALFEALEKVKAELMVLGFISLILTFSQNYIAKICIPMKLANTMLPCRAKYGNHEEEHGGGEEEHRRRLLWLERRILAGGAAVACKEGYVPLISLNALHQLHIFIFFLAVFHVMYSAITMLLGRLKIRGWKEWENEYFEIEEAMNDPTRFRLTKETSFVKDHTSFWTRTPILFCIVCFFRQFFRSVRKADYLTMRHGFVSVHLAPGSKFNFQKYIKRSLEDDFKVVVGISPILWTSVVVFLLVNVHGWHSMLWVSVLPLLVILAVGTKLQAIITNMALEIQERHAVVQGIPLVQVSDKNFWFHKPKLVLFLIHFVLFMNAFEITYFLWIWYEFGLKSCFHDKFDFIIVRVGLGVGVQFLCSYITLPLYALVTQMGSTMKRSIFDEQTSKALKQWHKNALKKKADGKPEQPQTRTLGTAVDSSPPAYSPRQRNIVAKKPEEQELMNLKGEASEPQNNDNIMVTVDLENDQQRGQAQRDLLS